MIWVFVSCARFLLVIGVRFVGLAVLDGVAISLAVGRGCHCRCGHRPWVMVVVLGFFCLGCWVAMVVRCLATTVVGCACVVGCHLICGVGLVVLWVAV